MADIHKTFMYKSWLRLREGNTLWSRFMLGKYCRIYHPKVAKVHSSHSRVWKNLIKVREEAESFIHWQLGRGECDFFLDSWMSMGPLSQIYPEQAAGTKVKDYWKNGMWDVEKLSLSFPQHLVRRIQEVFFDTSSDDVAIWKESKDGKFDFKLTLEDIRNHRAVTPNMAVIWHRNIPRKMSFLVWRLLHNWLPVDEMMSKKGIAMASKCVCCCSIETMEHVFFTNPVAVQIWVYFARLVGINHSNITNVQQLLRLWSHSTAVKGHIRQVIPVVVLWGLWEARNKAKQADEAYTFHRICSRVANMLNLIARATMNRAEYWVGESYLGAQIGVQVLKSKSKQLRLLKWEKPAEGTLKLNIDAAYKDSRAGYGGIIRDASGSLVAAVGIQGFVSTSLQAELEALWFCLKWCTDKGFDKMQIEVDSQQVVKMVSSKVTHWSMHNMMLQVADLMRITGSSLKHIFREGNTAADWIAKLVWRMKRNMVWHANTSDCSLHRLVQLEQEGLPQIRLV